MTQKKIIFYRSTNIALFVLKNRLKITAFHILYKYENARN